MSNPHNINTEMKTIIDNVSDNINRLARENKELEYRLSVNYKKLHELQETVNCLLGLYNE